MGTRVDNLETQIYELQQQNERLQAELDKQIKDNRKLVKALKEYASPLNWHEQMVWQRPEDTDYEGGFNGEYLAKETLKEIEEG